MFHIQTEDYGYPRCYFCSHIFVSGQVIRSVRTEYPPHAEQQSTEEELRKVMLTAHRSLFKMLQNGDFDEHVASAPANDIVPSANETGFEAPKTLDSSDTQKNTATEAQGGHQKTSVDPPTSKHLAPPPRSATKPVSQARPLASPPTSSQSQAKTDSAVRGPMRLSWPPRQESPSSAEKEAPNTATPNPRVCTTPKPLSVPSAPKPKPKQKQAREPSPGPASKKEENKSPIKPLPVAKPAPAQPSAKSETTEPTPAPKAPAPKDSTPKTSTPMSSTAVRASPTLSLAPVALEGLKALSNTIKGLLAVAYFDTTTLKPLFVSDEGLCLQESLDALAEFCFALQSGCESVSPGEGHFEVVSQTKEHFLIMIQITGSAQLFLAISRKLGNLAMARYTLDPLTQTLREHPPKRG